MEKFIRENNLEWKFHRYDDFDTDSKDLVYGIFKNVCACNGISILCRCKMSGKKTKFNQKGFEPLFEIFTKVKTKPKLPLSSKCLLLVVMKIKVFQSFSHLSNIL